MQNSTLTLYLLLYKNYAMYQGHNKQTRTYKDRNNASLHLQDCLQEFLSRDLRNFDKDLGRNKDINLQNIYKNKTTKWNTMFI